MPITPAPIIVPQVHHSGCSDIVFIDNIHLYLFVAIMICEGVTLAFAVLCFVISASDSSIISDISKAEDLCVRMASISFAITLLFFISFIIYGYC